LRLAGLVAAAGGVMGHSPYRQWQVYRKSRLIIVTSAAEPASYPLGDAIATLLARRLPDSPALAGRADDAREIVKLLSSSQLDLAILTAQDARDAHDGLGRFAAEGALPLRALAVFGPHLLVCRDDFPAATPQAIASTLAEHWRGAGAAAPTIPFHASLPPAFPDVAARVVDAFTTETGGGRNVRIDSGDDEAHRVLVPRCPSRG